MTRSPPDLSLRKWSKVDDSSPFFLFLLPFLYPSRAGAEETAAFFFFLFPSSTLASRADLAIDLELITPGPIPPDSGELDELRKRWWSFSSLSSSFFTPKCWS